jgi:hypothetical protein
MNREPVGLQPLRSVSTSQYLAGAVTVAILTLVLGPSPTYNTFRTTFLLTTAAAVAGIVHIAVQRRRLLSSPTHPFTGEPPEDARDDQAIGTYGCGMAYNSQAMPSGS